MTPQPKSSSVKWWDKEPYKCIHRNPFTGDALSVHWDIPAVIAEARRLEAIYQIESFKSTLSYMKANPLPNLKSVSKRNHGWNEAIDYLLERISYDPKQK